MINYLTVERLGEPLEIQLFEEGKYKVNNFLYHLLNSKEHVPSSKHKRKSIKYNWWEFFLCVFFSHYIFYLDIFLTIWFLFMTISGFILLLC